ncbi:MAG: oligosaccharide flippase family protein [Clostridia bacterium]|nr:oligosaccharide flippase family protein [Clostridia bacterium]
MPHDHLKINQIKVGSILSYLQIALNVIIGIVYTPVMLRLLGRNEYGLYNTVASTISMLSILNLGFNSSYIRYYSKYKKNDDKESIYKLNGLFIIIFAVIGLIALVCGGFLSFNLDIVFDNGLTSEEYDTARILMLLLTVNLAVSFPMSVFQSIISAHERFVFLKLLGMLKTVLSPLLTLPLLLFGYKSVALVAVTLAVQLLTDIIYFVYVVFKLKNKFVFHGFEPGIMKSLFIYTGFIAINMIVDQINWNVDKLLLGRYKGTATVAVYSVGFSLHHYYNMFSKSVSSLFTPKVHMIINKYSNDIAERNRVLTELFVKVGRIQFIILALIGSGLVFFGRQFIYFWAGPDYSDAYYVTLLLTLPSTIALIQNLGIEIQRAENNHRFRSIVYLFMALLNLGISIVLCQLYGAVGAAIGTAFALIVANGIIMNIFYHMRCGINILEFWKNILRVSCGLIPPIIAGILLNHFIEYDTLLKLAAAISVYTVIYCLSMRFLGMNDYEKKMVDQPIMKLLKRK